MVERASAQNQYDHAKEEHDRLEHIWRVAVERQAADAEAERTTQAEALV